MLLLNVFLFFLRLLPVLFLLLVPVHISSQFRFFSMTSCLSFLTSIPYFIISLLYCHVAYSTHLFLLPFLSFSLYCVCQILCSVFTFSSKSDPFQWTVFSFTFLQFLFIFIKIFIMPYLSGRNSSVASPRFNAVTGFNRGTPAASCLFFNLHHH